MAKSPQFDKWKRLFDVNFATKEQLKTLAKIGAPKGLSTEEYEEITGEVYA